MHHRRALARAGVLAGVTAFALAAATPASAQLSDVNTQRLRNAVTVNGILAHERVFQRIANRNGGTRASGTPGYDESADVRREPRSSTPATTSRRRSSRSRSSSELAPADARPGHARRRAEYETATFEYSGSGEVTGPVVPTIDNRDPGRPGPPARPAGCEAADFDARARRAGDRARSSAARATSGSRPPTPQAAGYDAVIIFNEGTARADRRCCRSARSAHPSRHPGRRAQLRRRRGAVRRDSRRRPVTSSVSTETDLETATTVNVIADSPRRQPGPDRRRRRPPRLGRRGPGHQRQRHRGSATILEIAEAMAELGVNAAPAPCASPSGVPRRTACSARSTTSTASSDDELGEIYANLNFDMVGSPNYVRFVYDGDGSADR